MIIGFIGLGNLGRAITTRFASLGDELIIYNRNKEKIKDLPYEKVNTPKELLKKCDIIFLCLFDSDAVNEILTMENGLLCEELKNKTIIDLTTNHYEEVIEFHKMVNNIGGNYLENPVFGSVAPALKGELTVVSSGKKEIFDSIKPIFLGSFMATIAECTALAENCDIEKSKALEILGMGGGQSLVLKAKAQKLIDEDFSAHFSTNAINKDLHLVQDLAYNLNQPLYTAAIPKELFSKMKMMGKGEEDFSSIYQLFKKI
jgi:3-hydroxyisobutyrate dehydrogenase